MWTGPIVICLQFDIVDEVLLRSYARQRVLCSHRDPDELHTLGEYAMEAMLVSSPGPHPEHFGISVTVAELIQLPPRRRTPRGLYTPVETWYAAVYGQISDDEALCAYAEKRHRICWYHTGNFLDDLPRAAYEALIGSSEGPPTVDFGVRLRHVTCRCA